MHSSIGVGGMHRLGTACCPVRDGSACEETAMTEQMSLALRKEIRTAPTGAAMQRLLAEQVTLIKSISLDAAKRVHELTLQGIEDGTRSNEIAKEIMRSEEVSENRAKLIARTEVSRTAATLTEVRAKSVGSDGYIWRTIWRWRCAHLAQKK